MRLEVDTRAPEETLRLGQALGRLLRGGDVIGLAGELGAGKTQLVRGLARGLDIEPDVIYSPSFTLVAEHEGRLRLNHIDLFRLGDQVERSDEEEIGLVDYIHPTGVTAIEWYEKLARPEVWTLEVEIRIGAGDAREIRFHGAGERAVAILSSLGGDRTWR